MYVCMYVCMHIYIHIGFVAIDSRMLCTIVKKILFCI